MKKTMYLPKPAFADLYGPESKTPMSIKEIKYLAADWDKPVDELLNQCYEIETWAMKKAVNGFRYDTEVARKICDIWEGSRNDFTHLNCGLFVTPKARRFFLAGQGGAMTIFSHRCTDGSMSGWTDLIPISTEVARKYAEKYATPESLEEHFPSEEA